jgi:hypothetical protein
LNPVLTTAEVEDIWCIIGTATAGMVVWQIMEIPCFFKGFYCCCIVKNVPVVRTGGWGRGYMMCQIEKPPTQRETTPETTASKIHCTGK